MDCRLYSCFLMDTYRGHIKSYQGKTTFDCFIYSYCQHKMCFCSHLGAVGFGGRSCFRCLGHIAADVVPFSLTLAEQGQQGAQLGHRDGAVVPIAGQQVLQHLGRGLCLTFPLTCHLVKGAEQDSQGQNKHQLGLEGGDGHCGTAMR